MRENGFPLVSVVMPAYNAEKYIECAIESIVNQTYENFEFIIIDDCSQDSTPAIIKRFSDSDARIKGYRNEENLHIARSLNKGIGHSNGKYVARMDADDWAYPDRLEKQVQFMEQNPDVVICGGRMEICDEELNVSSQRVYQLKDEEIRRRLYYHSPFSHPLIMMRKDALVHAGLYNVNLTDAEDYELYFRLGNLGKFGNLDVVILKYRKQDTSYSHSRVYRQELNTLYVRIKSVMEYGYTMRFVEKVFLVFQLFSLNLVPPKFKVYLFNKIRNTRKRAKSN